MSGVQNSIVMPAQAGIQKAAKNLDASLRWHDRIGLSGMTG